MRTKVTTRQDDEIVSLDLVKDHARVDDGYDEELLDAYIASAIDIAETKTNRLLNRCSVVGYLPKYVELVQLPYGEADEVESVTGINPSTGGREPITYALNDVTEVVSLDVEYRRFTDIEITFSAGYKAASDIPKSIIQGILVCVATLYNVREDVSYGVQAFITPLTAERLFKLTRIKNM